MVIKLTDEDIIKLNNGDTINCVIGPNVDIVSIIKKDSDLIECNPDEHPECSKTHCFINGGECHMRTKKKLEEVETRVHKCEKDILQILERENKSLKDQLKYERLW